MGRCVPSLRSPSPLLRWSTQLTIAFTRCSGSPRSANPLAHHELLPADPTVSSASRPQGFQVNSHGIGDRANTAVLDIYESVLRNLTRADGRYPGDDAEVRRTQREWRLRVEHAQIMVRGARLTVERVFGAREGQES